jgi:SAM-dependent methyltransferase
VYGHRVFEPSSCPACGGPLAPWLTVPASDPALLPARFELYRCEVCGSAATLGDDPPPELYESGAYRPGTPRLHRFVAPLLSLFDRQRLALVRPLAPAPARLLDVGAGRGRFVLAARAAGYDASGIEPSLRGAEAATAAGAPVERVAIQQAAIAPGSVDAVSLWHVLEHLDDPGGALERIAGWLAPGGALLVGVPNLASLQARLGGERWFHLDVPRHRTHFTPPGLEKLLTRTGFSIVRTHQALLEHNPFGMWQTLVSRVTTHPSYVYNVLKRNAPVRSPDLAISLAAVPLLPAAVALELAAGLAGRGGTVAVLAERRSEATTI